MSNDILVQLDAILQGAEHYLRTGRIFDDQGMPFHLGRDHYNSVEGALAKYAAVAEEAGIQPDYTRVGVIWKNGLLRFVKDTLSFYAQLVEYCVHHEQDARIEMRARDHGLTNALLDLAGHQPVAYETPALNSGNTDIDRAYHEVMTISDSGEKEPGTMTLSDYVRINGLTTQTLREIARTTPFIILDDIKGRISGLEKADLVNIVREIGLTESWMKAIEHQYR